jgi:hypothetical protein
LEKYTSSEILCMADALVKTMAAFEAKIDCSDALEG